MRSPYKKQQMCLGRGKFRVSNGTEKTLSPFACWTPFLLLLRTRGVCWGRHFRRDFFAVVLRRPRRNHHHHHHSILEQKRRLLDDDFDDDDFFVVVVKKNNAKRRSTTTNPTKGGDCVFIATFCNCNKTSDAKTSGVRKRRVENHPVKNDDDANKRTPEGTTTPTRRRATGAFAALATSTLASSLFRSFYRCRGDAGVPSRGWT